MSEVQGREVKVIEAGSVLEQLSRSEVDTMIASAHKWPRSVKAFIQEARDLITLSESVADECIYSLPPRRGDDDKKPIEGPSARFAEIIQSCWGNSRSAARVIEEGREFVVAQGVFFDLQKNVGISYEVRRRIVGQTGKRFGPDMIGVTANAACAIAMRNAVLKGIPKAFWHDLYLEARRVVMGDVKTLDERRRKAVDVFEKMGVTHAQVFALLKVDRVEDIDLEKLLQLRGIVTALKEGETTIAQVFAAAVPSAPTASTEQGETSTARPQDDKSAAASDKPKGETIVVKESFQGREPPRAKDAGPAVQEPKSPAAQAEGSPVPSAPPAPKEDNEASHPDHMRSEHDIAAREQEQQGDDHPFPAKDVEDSGQWKDDLIDQLARCHSAKTVDQIEKRMRVDAADRSKGIFPGDRGDVERAIERARRRLANEPAKQQPSG